MSFSSVVRTSPEGSSKDILDANRIQLNGCVSYAKDGGLADRREETDEEL